MAFVGTCKLFNPLKGFGFITTPEGTDIFLHIAGVADGSVPQKGDALKFDLVESKMKPGQMQAENVSGGTGVPGEKGAGKGGPAPPPGQFQGSCKSFVSDKGFGFIIGADGADVFFHVRGMTDGTTPQAGDMLSYDLEESKSKPGQMQASNIQGGTGWAPPKGGGKDGGKGGYGGAWGAADSWGGGKAGPYGGGKDSGKGGDGGKGKMMAMMSQMMASWGGGGGGDSWGGDASWSAGGGKGGGKDSWGAAPGGDTSWGAADAGGKGGGDASWGAAGGKGGGDASWGAADAGGKGGGDASWGAAGGKGGGDASWGGGDASWGAAGGKGGGW